MRELEPAMPPCAEGKPQRHCGAASVLGVESDRSSVCIHNLLNEGEAQAMAGCGSRVVGAPGPFERVRELIGGHSYSVVANLNDGRHVRDCRGHADGTGWVAEFERIVH
ncbi:hypothetical protein ABIB15_001315 [Marisediminicola sp. UYEF4]